MKKLLSIMLCIIMLTGLMPVNAALGAKVVSDFDSFEAKKSGVFSASMRKAEYSEDVANTGKVSIKVPADPDHRWSILTLNTEFKANREYTLSFYAYASDGNSYLDSEIQYNVNGSFKRINLNSQSRAIPIGQFGRVIQNFKINAEPDDNITDTKVVINVRGGADVYIDDLEVIDGSTDIPEMKTKDLPFYEIVPKDDNYIDLFVAQEAAPGGDGSLAQPFSSLVEARDYVRTINKDMKSNIRVNVRGGYYFMTDPFVLTDEDSGTNGYHVIYQPYNNEEVIISGGEKVTGWTESEIPGVYKTSLHAPTLRNLYVNDVRAQRARLEEYVTPISWWDDESDSLSKKDGFVIPKGIIKNPEKATNLEIFKSITYRGYWAVKGRAEDSGETTILKMRQPQFYDQEQSSFSIQTWNDTDDFRLENALEFLDKPGEWFQDIDTDTLYYMPLEGENIYESEIIVPRTEEILKIQGSSLDNRAEDIVVSGFTFAHGANDWTSENGRCINQSTAGYTFDRTYYYNTGWRIQPGNLKIANARNVAFRDNVVKHMDSVGLSMPFGVENCEIKGNRMYDTSSSAINIGEADHQDPIDIGIIPTNIRISNNILADSAVEYGSCPTVACYYADGMYIENNEVYDMGYSGLSLGWGWVTKENYAREYIVKNNRFWGANQICTDGAAIYTLGNVPGSVIEGNYLGIKPAKSVANFIYHDSGSCNFYSEGNVIDCGDVSVENWISTYQPQYENIVMYNNYTTSTKRLHVTKTAVESKTHLEPDGSWSKDARDIIERAGLSAEYKGMRELMPDWKDHTAIRKVTLQTKEYDNAIPVPLKSGESATLTAQYERICGDLHYGDSFSSITSTDESVVRIEGNKIVAAGPGLAVVSATTSDGYSASLSVTVDDKAEKLTLLVTTNEVKANDVMYLKYVLKTKYWNYFDLPHEYTSSRPYIATIDDMGIVRGKVNGKTKLTLKVFFGDEILEKTWDIQVKDASASSTIEVDKYIYEVSEDSEFLASLAKGNTSTKLSSANTSAIYKSLVKEGSGAVPDTYTDNMKFLFSQGLIDTSANPSDFVTDEQLTTYIENMTGKNREEFCVVTQNVPLTRERAAYILSNALVYIWAEHTLAGKPRLGNISDRDEVSPEYIPYVANAVWCEMFDINAVQTKFEPKKLVTYDDVGMILNRLKNPKNIRNYVYEDFWFNRAYEGEGTVRAACSLDRSDKNKIINTSGVGDVELSGGLLIPENPGNYSVSLMSKQGANLVTKDDYCYVYDKNDIISDDEFKTVTYGDEGMYSYVLKEGDKLRMISNTGDVWGEKDECTYSYKMISDTDFEMTLTVDSFANSDPDAGAGIMLRKSDSATDIKIDYRIKPGGNTFLCYRTKNGEATNFSQGKNLSFPVTLKLVKEGDLFTAYYLDGDKWVRNMSVPLVGMTGSYLAGPYMSSLSTRSKRPGSAIFSNIYMGKIRAMDNEDGTVNETPKPEKEPESIDPNFKLDKRYYYDTIPDGTFEKGVYGWNTGEGTAAQSSDAYSGRGSLVLTPNENMVYVAYSLDSISIKQQKHYIAFMAKTDTGTATLTPYIQYFRDGKVTRSTATYKTERKIDAEGWKEVIVEVDFEAYPEKPMLVINSSGSSRVFIDNVEILYERDNVTEEDLEAPIEEAEEEELNLDRRRYLNKFTNGSFERGVSGWNPVGGSVKATTVQKFSGSKAMQFIPDSSGAYMTHSVAGGFKANKKYYLVFRAKTKEGTATFSPYIQYHNGKGHVSCKVSPLTDMTANSTDWKEFIVEMTFPVNPTSELMVLGINTKSEVYIDSVELLYN